jgi:RimK family alpha-L-glutamate ligase
MGLSVIASRRTETNLRLAELADSRFGGCFLTPREAMRRLHAGDFALARLDVRRTLDGVEPGLESLAELECRGVLVLNSARALLTAHDKLLTAELFAATGIPHPTTVHLTGGELPPLAAPLVLKPRFGSWGRDVLLCSSPEAVRDALRRLRRRPWFRRHGVLAQELIPPVGRDVRVLVAGGRVVGAVQRVAAAGEWRTNVALGAARRPVVPPREARRLALAAAVAIGGDLVGIDLLPQGRGGFIVLEVNGAVEFTEDYSLGRDVYAAVSAALARLISTRGQSVDTIASAAEG